MSVSHALASISSLARGLRQAAALIFILASLSLEAGAHPSTRRYAPPQQEPSELDKLLLKGRQPKGGTTKPTEKTRDEAGGRPAGRGRGARTETAAPVARTAVGLSVTFVANEPEVEFTVLGTRGKMLLRGRTGPDNRFSTKLSPGKYTVSMSRGGRLPRFQQQVSVSRDITTFNFNFPARPKEAEEPGVAESAEAEAAPTPTPAPTPLPARPEAVIRNFLDPKQTENVSAEDWRQVLSQTRDALQHEPNNKQLKGRELFVTGYLEYLAGNYEAALASFRQAAPLSTAAPEQLLVALGLGHTHLARDRADEAAAAYRSATEKWPDSALAFKGLGDALAKMRHSTGADAAYGKAMSLGYVSDELVFNKGHQEARNSMRNDCAQALKFFLILKGMLNLDSASRIRNTFQADMFTDMGYCYAEQKQTALAHDSYRRANTLDPNNAWTHYRYGESLFKEREYAEAARELDRALQLFMKRNQPGDREDYKRVQELKEKADKKLSKSK